MTHESPGTLALPRKLSRDAGFSRLRSGGGGCGSLIGCEKNKGLVTNLPDPLAPYSPRSTSPTVGYVPSTAVSVPQTPITPTESDESDESGESLQVHLPQGVIVGNYSAFRAWAKAGPDMPKPGGSPMGSVGLITFHHSGDPKAFLINDYAEGPASASGGAFGLITARGIFRTSGLTLRLTAWGGSGSFGRWRTKEQHVRYNNEHNVGVVVLGNFDLQVPDRGAEGKKSNRLGSCCIAIWAVDCEGQDAPGDCFRRSARGTGCSRI